MFPKDICNPRETYISKRIEQTVAHSLCSFVLLYLEAKWIIIQGYQCGHLSPISVSLSWQGKNLMSWIPGRCITGFAVSFPACIGTHLPTLKGWKAELTLAAWLSPDRRSPIQGCLTLLDKPAKPPHIVILHSVVFMATTTIFNKK
jgi:hypothetical protein